MRRGPQYPVSGGRRRGGQWAVSSAQRLLVPQICVAPSPSHGPFRAYLSAGLGWLASTRARVEVSL